ncbi:hypothetical protein RND71_037763 [Anisodus tanguticus]|uniref:Uncharacterized protein n=1 Tax=Anisodus tanguticus TaxID=243964 RepID=A0AAE1USW7_9SOLA|nr:hypothetical protein RND71_037763 [Anisodus tanguticus]
MKEKIVIDLTLSTDNCISKAMQIAVRCAGVISVNTDKEKGHLVVIGVGVDFFKLMKCIKKKFNCARIASVEEVKPEKKPDPVPISSCHLVCPPNPCVQYYPNAQESREKFSLECKKDVASRWTENYPGYNNKMGAGPKCDEPFHLGMTPEGNVLGSFIGISVIFEKILDKERTLTLNSAAAVQDTVVVQGNVVVSVTAQRNVVVSATGQRNVVVSATAQLKIVKKIVIDLPLNTDRCRSKAMQIAVRSAGVISVNIDKEKGHLVVIGIGVDFFKLMHCIRRKFKCSRIVIIEEVKPDKKPDPDPEPKPGCPKPICPCPPVCTPCVPYYAICQPVYDAYNPTCPIM